MSDIVKSTTSVSASTMESVLGTGDLSRLTVQQRVEYYNMVCKTVGLNPLTQPFRFLTFQGMIKLYATRDCADQLRKLHKIDLALVEKRMEGDLFIVTAQARTPEGRKDEDAGAVTIGAMKGEARANAILKAITKAKRRVTLSICGLGFLDESEVETLHGAQTFSANEPLTVTPITTVEEPRQEEASIVNQMEYALENETNGGKWLKLLDVYASRIETMDQLAALRAVKSVRNTETNADLPGHIKNAITDVWRKAVDRLSPKEEGASGFPGDWSTADAT